MENIIEATNITKKITSGRDTLVILDHINLTVYKKEFVAVMGASGSGKSTLLSILAGIDKPTSGSVKIDKVDLTGLNEDDLTQFRNKNIGVVFQSFNLIPSLSTEENVFVPLLFSDKKLGAKSRTKELLNIVGLYPKRKLKPSQLSGGEQQRVAIARALACKPKILFADEPTGALDSKNGELIMNLFEKCNLDYGMTIVMVTHDRNIGKRAGRMIQTMDGRIV